MNPLSLTGQMPGLLGGSHQVYSVGGPLEACSSSWLFAQQSQQASQRQHAKQYLAIPNAKNDMGPPVDSQQSAHSVAQSQINGYVLGERGTVPEYDVGQSEFLEMQPDAIFNENCMATAGIDFEDDGLPQLPASNSWVCNPTSCPKLPPHQHTTPDNFSIELESLDADEINSIQAHTSDLRNKNKGSDNNDSAKRKTCLGHGKTKCSRNIQPGKSGMYCKRHQDQFDRYNADPPQFRFPGGVHDSRSALNAIYPFEPPLNLPNDNLEMVADLLFENETVKQFVDAINEPYADQTNDQTFHRRQQKELNGKRYRERTGDFSDQQVNIRMRLLYRSVVVFHCGGQVVYPKGGDNSGYGPPDTTLKFQDRINRIINILEKDKRICMDVIQGRGVLAFVKNPDAYEKRKVQNMDSNKKKQDKHGIGSKVEEIVQAEGEEGDEAQMKEQVVELVKEAKRAAKKGKRKIEHEDEVQEDARDVNASPTTRDGYSGAEGLRASKRVFTKYSGGPRLDERAGKRRCKESKAAGSGLKNPRPPKKAKPPSPVLAEERTAPTLASVPVKAKSTRIGPSQVHNLADGGRKAAARPAATTVRTNQYSLQNMDVDQRAQGLTLVDGYHTTHSGGCCGHSLNYVPHEGLAPTAPMSIGHPTSNFVANPQLGPLTINHPVFNSVQTYGNDQTFPYATSGGPNATHAHAQPQAWNQSAILYQGANIIPPADGHNGRSSLVNSFDVNRTLAQDSQDLFAPVLVTNELNSMEVEDLGGEQNLIDVSHDDIFDEMHTEITRPYHEALPDLS